MTMPNRTLFYRIPARSASSGKNPPARAVVDRVQCSGNGRTIHSLPCATLSIAGAS